MKILDVTAPEDDEFIRLIARRDVLWHCPVLSSKGAHCSHIQEDSMKTKEVSKQRFLPKLAGNNTETSTTAEGKVPQGQKDR